MEGPAGVCATCGSTNAAGARFCSNCGSRLAAADAAPPSLAPPPEAPRPARELERKVITALFCDVVGSTELAERLDAEDVERLMSTYHARARRVIEAHGGLVEKFIGDAVVGVFGAPAAHEDDPSRAVRASLAILRDLADSGLDLHVRVGVHTGEAIVRVDDDRAPEEGIATGGSLNTAARVQNAAPIDGVAVGDPTYRLAAADFVWEDLGAVTLKGIAEPVRMWRPVEARSTAARADDDEATPFLGRDAELEGLVRAFQLAVSALSQQVTTIVAEPGLGKSRLVREFRRRVEAIAPGVTWRVGRCLPYGDGIAFWALGEIAKSHAGILETDDQATIAEKLDAVLLEQDPELRTWERERLAPLVGLRSDSAPASQEEAFAAWRRFLESLAANGPAVVVIEDLHWADTALVDFLLELVSAPAALPLMLLVTARPELVDRHSSWLERAAEGRVVQLLSLDDAAIAALIGSTLGDAVPELLATILERAGGSPLYAEQLAALIRERGLAGAGATLDEQSIPPSVQALLAARIDALPRELKSPLLDASVIGKVFWSGAVATLGGGDRATVEPSLVDLERRSFTRSKHPSTMVDEAEYGFWHALLREVAYGFLPRSARLAKHRSAAAWITARAGGNLGDLAEIVVDHLRRADELAGATSATDEQGEIRAELATALLAAANHVRRVEPARAAGHFRAALDLLPEDDPRRGPTMADLAAAHMNRSEPVEAERLLDAAQDWHRARGDELAAAELALPRSLALRQAGDAPAADAVLDAARPILAANPGPALVALLASDASPRSGLDRALVVERADLAIQTAERLGIGVPPWAYLHRGQAMLELQDPAGEAEMRRGIELAREAGDTRTVLGGLTGLAWALLDATIEEALAVYDEGLAFARDHGMADADMRANRLDPLTMAGRYDEVLSEAADLREWAAGRGDAYALFMADMQAGFVQFARGEPVPGWELIGDRSKGLGFPPTSLAPIVAHAQVLAGDPAGARHTLDAAVDRTPEGTSTFATVELVVTALRLDDLGLARRS